MALEGEAVPQSEADRLVAAAATRTATVADLEALEALCRRAPGEVCAALGDDDERASYLVYGRATLASEAGSRLRVALVETGAPAIFRALADPHGFGLLVGQATHMEPLGAALDRAGRAELLLPGIELSTRLAFDIMVGARDRDIDIRSLDADVDALVAELRRVPASLQPRLAQVVVEAAAQVARAGRHVADVDDMRNRVLQALAAEG